MPTESELVELEARRAELRTEYLRPPAEREPTPGRGIHHAALICSDVERTIQFYQGLLGFPLVELVENRDYKGSSHFFFDLGNQTLLGFFDFPGPRPAARRRVDRQRPAHRHLGAARPLGAAAGAARRGRHDVRRARPGHRRVDVLQGPGRHPDRAAERPADVLRRARSSTSSRRTAEASDCQRTWGRRKPRPIFTRKVWT